MSSSVRRPTRARRHGAASAAEPTVPVFRYEAVDQAGRTRRGMLDARHRARGARQAARRRTVPDGDRACHRHGRRKDRCHPTRPGGACARRRASSRRWSHPACRWTRRWPPSRSNQTNRARRACLRRSASRLPRANRWRRPCRAFRAASPSSIAAWSPSARRAASSAACSRGLPTISRRATCCDRNSRWR